MDWGALRSLRVLGTLKYLIKIIYMQRLLKMLGCIFSARLETKTELYKSMYCINDNVIGLLVKRQITYFDKWEYIMQ